MRIVRKALLLAVAIPVLAWAGTIELPHISAPEVWHEVFTYCQEVSAEFGDEGEPVAMRRPVMHSPPSASPSPAAPVDPSVEIACQASGGNPEREAAFRAWLAEEYAEPGETVMVAGTDEGGVYVLSEHGTATRCLKRYDMASGQIDCLTPTNETRELVGPLFSSEVDGEQRLSGLIWRSPEGARTEWIDRAMAAYQSRLEEAFPGAGFDWFGPGPERWIVRVRWPDRPPAWLSADVTESSWQVLAECPVVVTPTVRTVFRFTASDGEAVTGIFTWPDAPGPFPLVVFPHGGPGAISTTDFDERVWALADAGFAVFQPNYRGSVGFGKRFRLDGWGPEGIRRGLLDVREGITALFADPESRLDGRPPILLGGSWGGYVALAQLALFPDDYSGAVSFFGAFDLPELLQDAWKRTGEGVSPAAAERSRRSLKRQLGDPENPSDMAALAALSPIHLLDAIHAPAILFHNREDHIIPFAQSERMAAAMLRRNLPVLFRPYDGDHGWPPHEESDLYAALPVIFGSWMSQSILGGAGKD